MTGRRLFERCRSLPLSLLIAAALLSAPFASADDPSAPEYPADAGASGPGPEVRVGDVRAQLSASATHNGSIVMVTVRLPASMKNGPVHAWFNTRQYEFYPVENEPGAWQAVIGVSFYLKPGRAVVQVKAGTGDDARSLELAFDVTEGPYRSEVLRVPPRTVSPRPKDLKRIRKEQAEIKAVYTRRRPQKLWKGPFVLPVQSSVTSPYGSKRVYNGQLQGFHQGLDLKAAIGTELRAPAPGVVVMAKSLFFTGNTVLLDHGFGLFTIYGHLNRLDVKVGDRLNTGDRLGLAGMTGRASGPHLHWGAVIQQDKVNPMDLLKVLR